MSLVTLEDKGSAAGTVMVYGVFNGDPDVPWPTVPVVFILASFHQLVVYVISVFMLLLGDSCGFVPAFVTCFHTTPHWIRFHNHI